MIYLAYAGLLFVGWVFSVFTWNRAWAIGGQMNRREPFFMDFLCALALPVAVWSFRTIFSS